MKNVSKLVQLALVFTVILTDKSIFAAGRGGTAGQSGTANKKRQKLTKEENQLEKTEKDKEEEVKRQALLQKGFPGYGQVDPVTTPKASQETKASQKTYELTAEKVIELWNTYRNSPLLPTGIFPDDSYSAIILRFSELTSMITNLNDINLKTAYTAAHNCFNSTDIYNIKIVAQVLDNLIQAINQAAPIKTDWQLRDVKDHIELEINDPMIKIPSKVNPLLEKQAAAASAVSGWISPVTNLYSSAKGAVSSGWEYAKSGVKNIREWKTPKEEDVINARKRLKKLEQIEAIDQKQRTADQTRELIMLKKLEGTDNALVTSWWPYFYGVGSAAVLYYLFPERAGKTIATAAAALGGYGSYRYSLPNEPTDLSDIPE